MTLLRAMLLEILVCVHLLGGAAIFRRFFPRESPWLAFFVPTLAVTCALNFFEHFIALPQLGWLLPLTVGGSLLALYRAGPLADGLRFPGALLVFAFTYIFVIRGLHPEIPVWTEGLSDLARVLDFCLGETVPPTDSWLPPYDHGGYYTFQHYGASILKRLFSLDIGTGYNISLVLLNALTCLMAAAVAFSLTGKRWIAAAMLLVVMASFTGSAILMILFGQHGFDALLYYDLHHGWADKHNNPLWPFLELDPHQQETRLFVPGSTIYMPEFHANLAGHFLTLMALLVSVEIFREPRTNWPWILLIVLPVLAVIAETWFVPVIAFILGGSLVLALVNGRRPENIAIVVAGSVVAIGLIWPSVARLTGGFAPQAFRLTLPAEHTFVGVFLEQWWPVYVPWLMLPFVWRDLSVPARWFLAAIPLLLIIFEVFTIGDREPTLEKIWSALYGAGLVAFVPLVFAQKRWVFRGLTILVLVSTLLCLRAWVAQSCTDIARGDEFFRMQGDQRYHFDKQRKRLLQVLQRLHGATILCGRTYWGYNEEPAMAVFSENRCFVGWTYPEQLAGNGDEPIRRRDLSNAFYDGTMADPLSFLRNNDIAAVLIWPDDELPDTLIPKLQTELGPEYIYIDCREGEPKPAGIFLRITGEQARGSAE